MKTDHEYLHGSRCEDYEDCLNCQLYTYDYSYGSTHERIGFVGIYSHHADDNDERILQQWAVEEATKEARQMWNDSECKSFLAAIRAERDDDSPKLIFADYLAERGMCEMQEQAIRKNCLPRIVQPA